MTSLINKYGSLHERIVGTLKCIRTYFDQKGTCIKGLFWPPLSQKLKVAFHQFHLVGLLEE